MFILDYYEVGGKVRCIRNSSDPLCFQKGDEGIVISKGNIPYNYVEVLWDDERCKEYKYPDPIIDVTSLANKG